MKIQGYRTSQFFDTLVAMHTTLHTILARTSRKLSHKALVAGALTLSLGVGSAAHADDMGQGEAHITTRSDVTMSVESGPRTSSSKLNAIAQHLGAPLGEVKRCYGGIIKEDPSVHGHINVALSYGEKGPLQIGLNAQGVESKKLELCVKKAFGALDLSDVGRPASATVKLEFDNSAAAAAHHVEAKREEMAQVDIRTSDEGARYSEDRTEDGKVSFRVQAKGPGADEAVTAAHHGLERALPRLLDCRRRASKNGTPAGDTAFNVLLKRKGKPQVDAISSSVEHPMAKPCSQAALRRSQFDPGSGRVRVVVTFSE